MYSLEDLTIIIPSTLAKLTTTWINQINNYCLKGIRVIISIPPALDEELVYKKGLSKNLSVLRSKEKGQVSQRQYAYDFCSTKLIMHMDDDVLIDIKVIEKLLTQYQKLPTNSCLAPYVNRKSNNEKENKIVKSIKNLILYSSISPISGTVAPTSFPIPHQPIKNNPNILYKEVEWLPGGILILRKADVITVKYFKFKGKAYCEDLIQSYLFKSRGMRLYLSKYYCEDDSIIKSYNELSIKEFIMYLYNDYIIRNYYRQLVGKNIFLLTYVYLFIITGYIYRNLLKKR